MPPQYLPISAAPLGQAPLGVIRPPDITTNIPNPLDITNFYRTQSLAQGNIGLMQNQQQIELNRERLDLDKYRLMVEETEAVANLINNSYNDFYGQQKATKQGTQGAGGGMFGNLDPSYEGDRKVLNKYQDEYAAMQDQLFKLGQSYLASGARDPGQRLEVVRQMDAIKRDFQRNIMNDTEFIKRNKAAAGYSYFTENLKNAIDNGSVIDDDAVNAIRAKYEAFANDTTGLVPAPNINDFNINNAIGEPQVALTNIAKDVTELRKGYAETVAEVLPNGTTVESEYTHIPTDDEIVNTLSTKWQADKNAQLAYKIYNKGRVAQGMAPIPFQEWVKLQVPTGRPEGEETFRSDIGTVIRNPPEPKTGTRVGADGKRDDGTWFGTSDDKARTANAFAETIEGMGYQITAKDLFPVKRFANDPERYDVEVDEETGKAVVYAHAVDSDGNRIMGEGATKEKAYEFNQPPVVKRSETSSTTPVPEDATLGLKNNNPFNLRPTSSERKQGIPLGQKGFKKFETLEEGFIAGFSDIKNKAVGNSPAMKNSEYMKSKYTPEELKNYEEVATVRDLINVWSPRDKFGGDNSDKVVDSYEDSVWKTSKIPLDTKLSEMGDEELLEVAKAMVRVEAPDAYKRLFEQAAEAATTTIPESTPNLLLMGENLIPINERVVNEYYPK